MSEFEGIKFMQMYGIAFCGKKVKLIGEEVS